MWWERSKLPMSLHVLYMMLKEIADQHNALQYTKEPFFCTEHSFGRVQIYDSHQRA
jgi:hypothetical protein